MENTFSGENILFTYYVIIIILDKEKNNIDIYQEEKRVFLLYPISLLLA